TGVHLGDRSHALQEEPELLHGGGLRPDLAGLVEGRAVVVRGVDDGGRQPTPRGAAERHVEVLEGEPVGAVRVVEDALVPGALADRHALVRADGTPVVEPAATELGDEAGSVGWRRPGPGSPSPEPPTPRLPCRRCGRCRPGTRRTRTGRWVRERYPRRWSCSVPRCRCDPCRCGRWGR